MLIAEVTIRSGAYGDNETSIMPYNGWGTGLDTFTLLADIKRLYAKGMVNKRLIQPAVVSNGYTAIYQVTLI